MDKVEEGPWRATRLWNSIVRSLHDGMPMKKHRKHLRTYENCFSANEAIEYLQRQLQKNPNFDSEVSKDQTLLLLQKLLRAGVIYKIENDLSLSNTMLAKTPAMLSSSSADTPGAMFKPGSDLYRLAPQQEAILKTPSSKSKRPSQTVRSPLVDCSNTHKLEQTPVKSRDYDNLPRRSRQLSTTTSQSLKSFRSSFRRIKNRDFLRGNVATDDEELQFDSHISDEQPSSSSQMDLAKRENLNLSYLQSLPANSLIILDNDSTWKEVYLVLLKNKLSEIHVNSIMPSINVSHIIYNMTKISEKGVVQLNYQNRSADLPKWTLSAMKCLANWPKPFQALMGPDGMMPNYNGFEIDVFNVVKEYFTSLSSPLTTFELYDVFVSAFIRAEAVSAQSFVKRQQRDSYVFAVTPKPYLETDLDSKPSSTSTPTSGYHSATENYQNYGRMVTNNERVAHIRQTLHILPPQPSNTNIESQNPQNIYSTRLNANMSPTAIMRNFLPPNTCFETAFMDEVPITRIVPQKINDTIHFRNGSRPPSRAQSCQVPLASASSLVSSAWDSRSIATQTSDEESHEQRASSHFERRRQPKWRRMARQRKSIAVMETNKETMELTNRFRSSSYSTGALQPSSQSHHYSNFRSSSSVDDLLNNANEKDKQFLEKYERLGDFNATTSQQNARRQRRFSMVSLPTSNVVETEKKLSSPTDNVILSKTVRKEKRKQRDRRERSCERFGYVGNEYESPKSTVSTTSLASSSMASSCNHYRTLGQYRHLTVKTPIHICGDNAPIPHMDEGMQNARAVPYKDELNPLGKKCAIEAFQLLGLLLPPENRRKLQLLLKFMRRVSSKQGLVLNGLNVYKSCYDEVLDTFAEAILKPKSDLANYDEELCKRIVSFFMENYDEIWTPPVSLRKEVEERVYQSLVSKRIEAGEDPYPITFCKRVPSKVYEREKVSGVQAAMLDLLEHILQDQKMSTRDKRKKLKNFKASYPDVYAKKFPSPEDEPAILRRNMSVTSLFRIKTKSVMRI